MQPSFPYMSSAFQEQNRLTIILSKHIFKMFRIMESTQLVTSYKSHSSLILRFSSDCWLEIRATFYLTYKKKRKRTFNAQVLIYILRLKWAILMCYTPCNVQCCTFAMSSSVQKILELVIRPTQLPRYAKKFMFFLEGYFLNRCF